MDIRTAVKVLLIASVLLAGVPGSLAYQQYLADLSQEYGDGSCGTCHVKAEGGGAINSYGTLFKNKLDQVNNASSALIAIGPPPAASESPNVSGTQKAPGFGFLISVAGLSAWLIRRNKR